MKSATLFFDRWFGGLVIFCATFSFAQTSEWTTYNSSKNQLANDDVRAIAVDGDFVWFGTFGGGLSRYQKSTDLWTTFNTSNSEIKSNFVYALAIDGGQLWIGTDKGANRYDPSTRKWMNYDTLSCVSGIAPDSDEIWFATRGRGVYRYHRATEQWGVLNSTNSSLASDHVSSVVVDGEHIWIGTIAGVNRYHQFTGEWEVFTPPNTGGIRDSTGYAIAVDGESVWFGHNPGYSGEFNRLIRLIQISNPTNCSPLRYVSEVSIKVPGGINASISQWLRRANKWAGFETCVAGPDTFSQEKICYPVYAATATANEVWFGAGNHGLYRLHKASGALANFTSANSGLAGDLVWAIAIDADEVWIATGGRGVSRYRQKPDLWRKYRLTDGLCEESVQCIDVFGDEAWFGTRFGLNRLQISAEKWQCFSPENSGLKDYEVWAIAVDSLYVWTAPFLQRYEKATGKWKDIDGAESKLGSSTVTAIYAERDSVWFGADDGKVSLHTKSTNRWQLFDAATTLLDSQIEEISVAQNDVWFASINGVSHYDKTTGKWTSSNTSNSGLPNDWVTGVAIDGDSVWFSAYGGGLILYEPAKKKWQQFTSAGTGLFALDFLWSVDIDNQYVWCGSGGDGVYRYEKAPGRWETFNPLTSPIVADEVWDIEVAYPFVWFASFNEPNLFEYSGGVNRYGDINPPRLAHSPVPNEQPSAQPVLILASINDNVEVKSAAVFYRSQGTQVYRLAPIQRFSADTWFGQIPGSDIVPGVMEYYLSASDGRNAATHPYSSAPNAPHRFPVYDAVPPIVAPSISSPNNTVADFALIDATIRLDGSGSLPTLQKIELMQYSESAARDSMIKVLSAARQDTAGNIISITGKIDAGDLRDDTKAVRLRVTATDRGHDQQGKPLQVTALSNLLFTPAPSTALAQITAPDSAAIVTGPVTIRGTASHPNIKQFILSYHDSLGNAGAIASGTEIRENAVLGTWDTKAALDGKYEVRLRVESIDGTSKTTSVPVVVDNTPPAATIDNLRDNDTRGGAVAIIGTAADKHFKMYRLEFGEGVNPVSYQPLAESDTAVVASGKLASWNTTGLNGLYSLRLRVADKAGLETVVTRILNLDNTRAQARISSLANGDVITGKVEIRGAVLDANLQQYLLEYAALAAPEQWELIASAFTPPSDGVLGVWNTQNLNGHFMLRLTAMDKTNSAVADTVNVIVDNDDPAAEFIWPRDGYQVGGVVQIRGTATDANFDKYALELAEGRAPEIFTPLTSTIFREPVVKGILHTWPVGNRAGEYTLQLTVHDKVGHKKAARAVVRIVEPIPAQRGGCVQSEDGKVELCLPPNALAENAAILINPLSAAETDPQLLGLVYEIFPTDKKLLRPGTLRMSYAPENFASNSEQQKLAIAIRTATNTTWRTLGGTVDLGRQAVTTAVNELGWFSLTLGEGLTAETLTPGIAIQPRVFSPIKGVFDYKTNVTITTENPATVTIKVYHPNGRLKKILRDNASLNRGASTIEWNGRDADGNVVPSGLYILLIEMEGKTVKKTVMVLNN
jgi:ligand-binding sensor domain-containing protein